MGCLVARKGEAERRVSLILWIRVTRYIIWRKPKMFKYPTTFRILYNIVPFAFFGKSPL